MPAVAPVTKAIAIPLTYHPGSRADHPGSRADHPGHERSHGYRCAIMAVSDRGEWVGWMWADLALVLGFVLLGGFFAAAELALVSLRPGQVSRLATQGR